MQLLSFALRSFSKRFCFSPFSWELISIYSLFTQSNKQNKTKQTSTNQNCFSFAQWTFNQTKTIMRTFFFCQNLLTRFKNLVNKSTSEHNFWKRDKEWNKTKCKMNSFISRYYWTKKKSNRELYASATAERKKYKTGNLFHWEKWQKS